MRRTTRRGTTKLKFGTFSIGAMSWWSITCWLLGNLGATSMKSCSRFSHVPKFSFKIELYKKIGQFGG